MSLIRITATLIGGLGFGMASHAVRSPTSYTTLFGFPANSTVANSASENPFIAISGGRTMAYSIALLGCIYLREDRAMSLMLMSGSIGAIVDGLSLIKYARSVEKGKTVGSESVEDLNRAKKAREAGWQHWTLMPVISLMGLWAFMHSES